MNRFNLCWFVCFLLFLSCRPPAGGQGPYPLYDCLLSALYKDTVPTLTPQQVTDLLDKTPEDILLLDSRSAAEFRVSHLASAQFLDFEKVGDEQLTRLPKNKTLVVYCTVGYRSERLGEQLKALGYPKVYHLYGGLFQWVKEGRPVVNVHGSTQKVHAYSRLWGIWLKEGQKVYE
ncbi:rhodanese-like domain-containing protein [Rufibacter glacialis]|uniref:Rhodanese-like domain-containing protein n=1 Tax=Rufibacter glacialis TaxID=1259555 RepID=A0A5M8QBM5_9BACT|nr:rhodanese-like domain-containing protein [Rufibacter glacialis]KAA6432548.1 rhodanese-like domain-containing protein [Rufibacter glacialis]GGK79714.1 hypothetical protein GCM10011405_29380 [Rufibacter glacialis]